VQAELSPAQQRVLALGALTADPEADAFAGIVDRVVDAAELLERAVDEVRRLAAMPAYGRVKLQLRSIALQRLARIVEFAEEPLLAHWT
jgi:enoyl-CoA hydratase/carnithine racemase